MTNQSQDILEKLCQRQLLLLKCKQTVLDTLAYISEEGKI